MHFTAIFASTLAFVTLVTSSAIPRGSGGGGSGGGGSGGNNNCNSGPVQCCNTVQSAASYAAGGGFIDLADIAANLLVALECSPITAIGVGGTQCNAQTVCCSNNSFNGLVNIGCTPININL